MALSSCSDWGNCRGLNPRPDAAGAWSGPVVRALTVLLRRNKIVKLVTILLLRGSRGLFGHIAHRRPQSLGWIPRGRACGGMNRASICRSVLSVASPSLLGSAYAGRAATPNRARAPRRRGGA